MKRRLKPIEYSLIAIPLTGVVLWRFDVALYLREFTHPKQRDEKYSCQSNLKRIGMSFQQYLNDSGGVLPPQRNTGQQGWTFIIAGYLHGDTGVFSCPTGFSLNDSALDGKAHVSTDFWMNGYLYAKDTQSITNSPQLLLAGDGTKGMWDEYERSNIPKEWLEGEDNIWIPARRHFGGANYLFLDGHVKWLRPNQLSNEPGTSHTFKPQFTKAAQSKTTSEPR